MPMSLTLIEAIAGHEQAAAVGGIRVDAVGRAPRQRCVSVHAPVCVDSDPQHGRLLESRATRRRADARCRRCSLALVADAWSRTYRSRAVTFSRTDGPQQTRNGIRIVSDRVAASWPAEQLVPAIGFEPPASPPGTTPFTASQSATEAPQPTSSPCSSNIRRQAASQ